MVRVGRTAKLEQLRRQLEAVRVLLEEIDESKVFEKLIAADPEKWKRLYFTLSAAASVHNVGSVVHCLVALHGALDQ